MNKDKLTDRMDEVFQTMCDNGEIDLYDLSDKKQEEIMNKAMSDLNDVYDYDRLKEVLEVKNGTKRNR